MLGVRGVARVGMLAVGLSLGAAFAATPGVASADSSGDPPGWLGGLDLFPAAGTSTLDFQISVDGYDLIPAADTSATASSGIGDIAIAFGSGSTAYAGAGSSFGEPLTPGEFDIAVANGTDSFASAGQGNFDSAYADGANSVAAVGGYNDVLSNGDFGMAWGSHTDAESGVYSDVPGGNDVAVVVDPFGTQGSSAGAGDGKSDFAWVFGDNSTADAGGSDTGASGDLAGNFDLAAIFGNGSDATAGASPSAPGDFDLAAIFGDLLHSTGATGGNFLVDILPTL